MVSRDAQRSDWRTSGKLLRIQTGTLCCAHGTPLNEFVKFLWHRASARCLTAGFNPKTPPGRAVPR